ncbi:hypothetical protein [Actinopolymorpha rutila]|uniref:Uncharacterized protein n=1 Tax=Actinopolymorpha rutila TaxID=446787 RepID=A0A852Z973_9ACTN|nr:hypothetical protein [Actinopolymorpha rutila]NYH89561.1 hypothetical protein [Actinopolymorpha rutila]
MRLDVTGLAVTRVAATWAYGRRDRAEMPAAAARSTAGPTGHEVLEIDHRRAVAHRPTSHEHRFTSVMPSPTVTSPPVASHFRVTTSTPALERLFDVLTDGFLHQPTDKHQSSLENTFDTDVRRLLYLAFRVPVNQSRHASNRCLKVP